MILKAFTTETQRHRERQKQKQQQQLNNLPVFKNGSPYCMLRSIELAFKVFSVSLMKQLAIPLSPKVRGKWLVMCLCGKGFFKAAL